MIEKTIVIDIDGVILEEKPTFERSLAYPIEGVAKKLQTLYDQGYYIILFTSRGWAEFWMTEKQLADWGIVYNQLIMGKPIAKYYVDDRGLSSLEELCKKLEIKL